MTTGTPNRVAIYQLADFIESAKFIFDMGDSEATPDCGSAGCIGGHAAILWSELQYETEYDWQVGKSFTWDNILLAKKLDISLQTEEALCFPGMAGGPKCRDVSRENAVRVLRRLAETGKVDWDRAMEGQS